MLFAVVAVVAVVVVALVVQLAVLWGSGRRRPIGDEREYLARGAAADPYAPRLFLRPPLLPWLAAVCRRGASSQDAGVRRLRLLLAVVSWLTVVATAVAGWQLGGLAIALLAALLLAAQPERIFLGCHVWPDTLLAFALAALCAVSTLPATPLVALAAGALSTLGVLTRIDFLATLPLLVAAWWIARGPLTAGELLAVLAPPLLALAVLVIRNARRYGIALPDTTWAFNLMLAQTETRLDDAERFTIDGLVARTVEAWRNVTLAETPRRGLEALWGALRPPLRFAHAVARRALTMVGPDTFVRMKLLPRDRAYPDLGERPRRWWAAALEIAFPALAAVILVMGSVDARLPPGYAWPSQGMLAVTVLFHARTRFRVTILPALCLAAAESLMRYPQLLAGRPLAAGLVLAGVLILTWALLRIRCSAEL